MTNDLRLFVILIDHRNKLIKEKFSSMNAPELFKFEQHREWYSKNISFIDEKLINIANKILKKQGIKNKIYRIEQVYSNITLKQLYYEEKPIYKKAINIEK